MKNADPVSKIVYFTIHQYNFVYWFIGFIRSYKNILSYYLINVNINSQNQYNQNTYTIYSCLLFSDIKQ